MGTCQRRESFIATIEEKIIIIRISEKNIK